MWLFVAADAAASDPCLRVRCSVRLQAMAPLELS